MLQSGDIISGMYQVIREIGTGGMGVIYIGYHLHLQKQIVIKKIKETCVDRVNVRGEADILKQLRHTYLPQVYDFLEVGNDVYTVMDYIPGENLQYYIDHNYTFPEETILLWMRELCEVLDYDYTDYCDQFGSYPQIVKTGKGEVEVVHKDLAGTCCYSNTKEHDDIVNVKTDKPAKDGMPEIVRLDSISQLFRNFPGKASLAELNAISSSKVAPITDEERVYVELSTGSLLIRVETDASGNIISDKAWNEIILKEANENRSENGTLNGVVIDAMTGEGVPAAKLEFKAKENAENSTHVTSGKDGSFSIELAADVYEVTISADGYVDETFEFEMEKDKNYSGEQFTISPELAAGSARIVLEWNAQHQDLDSYLWGNTDKGDDLYVNFRKRTCEGRDGLLAELDVDDTNGYGPETITLNDLNGVYTYSVVDYRTTGTLQQYGATVKVYLPGKSAPTVITLDPNAGVENVWEVFELDHGELKILNRAPAEENLRPGSK